MPRTLIHHSPTGFEIGYSGSGVADLALNILHIFNHYRWRRRLLSRILFGRIYRRDFFQAKDKSEYDPVFLPGHYTKVWNGEYCSREAYALHQQFKEDFLVKSRDEITIPAQTITEWIEHNLKTHLIG